MEYLVKIDYKARILELKQRYLKITILKSNKSRDEEKTTFHTEKGLFCYTKMPFGLKNAGATYQKLVDTIFEGHIGRNLEVCVDDMVIKSKIEQDLIQDIEETLLTLKKVNMKLNPKKYSFRMEEAKFLGYIVTSKRIRANPEKAKAMMSMPSLSNLNQMQSLSGKLTALNRSRGKICSDGKTGIGISAFSYKAKKVLPCPCHQGQVLVDFLVETVVGDDPICKKVPNLETTPDSKEVLESAKAREEPANMDLIDEVEVWKLYTDGASNDHGFEAGLILID
nr:reverse transcriptase domain-containing protein [Tanacetum cinerariifolium]